MSRFARFSVAVAQLLFLALALCLPARSADTITVKIGYSSGGAYDAGGRLFAEYLARYLPGAPSVMTQNVPGGGGLKLTKMMAATEPADGSVIALVNPSLILSPLFDPAASDLDPRNFKWIGSLVNRPVVCYATKASGVATLADFTSREFLVGATAKSSQTYMFAALVKNLLGARFSIVSGFNGGGEIEAAAERGEIHARCAVSISTLLTSGAIHRVNPILQLTFDVPDETRDIPSLLDLVQGDIDRSAARLAIGGLRIGYPLFMPPGTPDDIVARYREAFGKIVADPQFRAEAEKRGVEINPTSGPEVEALVADFLGTSPAIVARTRELIE